MTGSHLPTMVVRSLILAGLALLTSLGLVSWQAINTSEQLLFPQLARKAVAEAEQAQRKINYALALGIPADRLVGTGALFTDMKKNDGDITFIGITDPSGKVLFSHGLTKTGLNAVLDTPPRRSARFGMAPGQSLRGAHLVTKLPLNAGVFYLGHNEQALIRPLADNLFDIAVVVLVTMLLAFEVMLLVVTVNFIQPARAAVRVLRSVAANQFDKVTGCVGPDELGSFIGNLDNFVTSVASRLGLGLRSVREPSVIGARLLAFLFVFAEELGRPFLPSYVAGYVAKVPGLDINVGTGVVIGLHMVVAALVMPVASMFYVRLGRVRLYTAGAIIATIGLAGTGLAAGYWDLLVWRALSAVGYASTFVACQGFVLEATNRENLSQGTAMMVSGITLADICGPAFGGVFAERVGQGATFLVGAGVAIVAALLAARLMARVSERTAAPRYVKMHDFVAAFRNRRLTLQIVLGALPAKLLLTGFLFYLVPVLLLKNGQSEGDVGRIVMIYGLAMMVGSPLFARFTDRWGNYGAVVALGGIFSTATLLLFPLVPTAFVVLVSALAVAGLGIGQSMSITAQTALTVSLSSEADVRQGQTPELMIMRFIERLGGGFGPLIAATLAARFDITHAIALLGAYAVVSFLLFWVVVAARPTTPPQTAESVP